MYTIPIYGLSPSQTRLRSCRLSYCLLDTSTWISHRHLMLNMYKMEHSISPWNYFSVRFSISVNDIITHPVAQIRNIFDFYLSPIFKSNIRPSPIACSSKTELKAIHFFSYPRSLGFCQASSPPLIQQSLVLPASSSFQIQSPYSIWNCFKNVNGGGDKEAEHGGFLRVKDFLCDILVVGTCHSMYFRSAPCQNPSDLQPQEWTLMSTMNSGWWSVT